MKIIKGIAIGVACFVGLLAVMFAFGVVELEFFRFFAPRRQNIQREVFENTKSYTQGKIQDLAKYFDEYQKAKISEDKDAIASVVKMRFAEFDANKINATGLRQFLINTRGY